MQGISVRFYFCKYISKGKFQSPQFLALAQRKHEAIVYSEFTINKHKQNQTETQIKKQSKEKCSLQLKPNVYTKVKWMH